MEQSQQQQQNEPREQEPEGAAREEPPVSATSPVHGMRCPFCHETMPFGSVAGVCEVCTAPHHPQCFAEHRGCAVAGCAGRSARATPLAARLDHSPRCATCKDVLEPDTWIAQCSAGCRRRDHVECHTTVVCPTPNCVGTSARFGTLAFLDVTSRLASAGTNLLFARLALIASTVGLLLCLGLVAHGIGRPGDEEIAGGLVGVLFLCATLFLAQRMHGHRKEQLELVDELRR